MNQIRRPNAWRAREVREQNKALMEVGVKRKDNIAELPVPGEDFKDGSNEEDLSVPNAPDHYPSRREKRRLSSQVQCWDRVRLSPHISSNATS
jgi:hypothetical protein